MDQRETPEAFKAIARDEFDGGVEILERCISTIGSSDNFVVMTMRDALNRVKRSSATLLGVSIAPPQSAPPAATTTTSTDLVPLTPEQKQQDATQGAESSEKKAPPAYALAHAKVKNFCPARNYPDKQSGCKYSCYGNAIGKHKKSCKTYLAMQAALAEKAKADREAKKAAKDAKGQKASAHPKKRTLRAAG